MPRQHLALNCFVVVTDGQCASHHQYINIHEPLEIWMIRVVYHSANHLMNLDR